MPGSIVHFELPAADVDRAGGFRNGLFGWGLDEGVMPAMDYRMTEVAPGQGVAVFESDEAGSGPIVHLSTDDIEGDHFSLWQVDEGATMPA
jgi:predicted enzyme related to lactoylglutathione lyase